MCRRSAATFSSWSARRLCMPFIASTWRASRPRRPCRAASEGWPSSATASSGPMLLQTGSPTCGTDSSAMQAYAFINHCRDPTAAPTKCRGSTPNRAGWQCLKIETLCPSGTPQRLASGLCRQYQSTRNALACRQGVEQAACEHWKAVLTRMLCHLRAGLVPFWPSSRCAKALNLCTVLGQCCHRYASQSVCTAMQGFMLNHA